MTDKKKCRNYSLFFSLCFALRYHWLKTSRVLSHHKIDRTWRLPTLVGFLLFALGPGCWLVLFIVLSFIIG